LRNSGDVGKVRHGFDCVVVIDVIIVGKKSNFLYVLHLDIKDQKIWIQHDGTEIGIADELVKLGVPKSDIVLAFHEPLVRQYTDFAVG
jgi:hypothetical protein